MAFKYFSEKLGVIIVKWVNLVKESGLPYDIVVEGKNDSKEYVEVKSTTLARMDWFCISVREWQFAVEKVIVLALHALFYLIKNGLR